MWNKETYLDNFGCCPYCEAGEEDVESDLPDHCDRGEIIQSNRCTKCGAAWNDIYKFHTFKKVR